MDVLDNPLDLKKALIRMRNKKLFIQQRMIEDKARENERAADLQEVLESSYQQNYAGPSQETVDKVGYYRNKVTGHKREAKERWNRFAGTESGGGRGL
jgi:hypothetical protein